MAHNDAYSVYVISQINPSYTATLIELTAPSTYGIEIVRAWVSQSSSAASAQIKVAIQKMASAGTGTSFTPKPLASNAPASGTTAIISNTVEGGTPTGLLYDNFNALSGWLYVPARDERIYVPGGGILTLTLLSGPATMTYTAGVIFREL